MIDWGSVPSYVGVGALLFTGIAFERDRRERKRSQANKIAAWVERATNSTRSHKVLIKNASDLPCTDVRIWWREGHKKKPAILMSKTFGANATWHRKPRYIHAIGPGETLEVHSTHEEIGVDGIEFSDASGKQWVRYKDRLTVPAHMSVRQRIARLRPQWTLPKRFDPNDVVDVVGGTEQDRSPSD